MDMARGPWLALKVEQLLSSPRLRELLEDATYIEANEKAQNILQQSKGSR